MLTRNVDKAAGLVNGTMVHVREWNDSLMVTTPTQGDVMLLKSGKAVFIPLCQGMLSRLLKCKEKRCLTRACGQMLPTFQVLPIRL